MLLAAALLLLATAVVFATAQVGYDLYARDHTGRNMRADSILNAVIGAVYGAFVGLATLGCLAVFTATDNPFIGIPVGFVTALLWSLLGAVVVVQVHADTTYPQRRLG